MYQGCDSRNKVRWGVGCKISKDLNVVLFRVSPNQTRRDEQTETPQKRRQSAEFMELSSLLINNVTVISWIL